MGSSYIFGGVQDPERLWATGPVTGQQSGGTNATYVNASAHAKQSGHLLGRSAGRGKRTRSGAKRRGSGTHARFFRWCRVISPSSITAPTTRCFSLRSRFNTRRRLNSFFFSS